MDGLQHLDHGGPRPDNRTGQGHRRLSKFRTTFHRKQINRATAGLHPPLLVIRAMIVFECVRIILAGAVAERHGGLTSAAPGYPSDDCVRICT